MLLDSTMSGDMAVCPARFYMRHRKNWARTGNLSIEATFGSAWGKAQDQIWPEMCQPGHGNEAIALENAIAAFRAYWQEAGYPETWDGVDEETLEEKKHHYNPKTAEEMLAGYLAQHGSTLCKWTLLGVEQAFVVPITAPRNCETCAGTGKLDVPGYWNDTKCIACSGTGKRQKNLHDYGGLPDKVVKTQEGHIIPIDHKSTSKYAKLGGFRMDWQEQFTLSGQIIGYTYELSLVHQMPVTYGIIDASLVHAKERGIHKMIRISVTAPLINNWLETQQDISRRVLANDESGIWARDGLQSGACNGLNGHFGCQFRDVCLNGYSMKAEQPPPGFEIRPWTPITELALQEKKG